MPNNSSGQTAIIVAIIGLLGTILVAIIGKINSETSHKSQISNFDSEQKTEINTIEKSQSNTEVIFDDIQTKRVAQSHDCLIENNFRDVTFIETQGSGRSKEYVMVDESGKKEEYIINEDNLSNAAQIRISHLKLGDHLTIKCAICKALEGGSIEELYIVFMSTRRLAN